MKQKFCPVCHNITPIKPNGTLTSHGRRDEVTMSIINCKGTGLLGQKNIVDKIDKFLPIPDGPGFWWVFGNKLISPRIIEVTEDLYYHTNKFIWIGSDSYWLYLEDFPKDVLVCRTKLPESVIRYMNQSEIGLRELE